MLVGMSSCGRSCIGHFDSAETLTRTELQDYASFGVNSFAVGLVAVIIGAILKAFGK